VSNRAKEVVRATLARAGVAIDGDSPFDVRIRDDRAYDAFVVGGLEGAWDAYVDGLWDTDRLDEVTFRVLRSRIELIDTGWLASKARRLLGRLTNVQAGARGRAVGRHYDLGNDLFEAMLDPRMVYSCGYWKGSDTLAAAQEAKLDLVCRKVGLTPGMRILDIGGGWGGLAQFAAERFGVHVVVTTISREQAELARARCRGLPIDVRLEDYRDLPRAERFDAIVSIGMFEHVGYKNYRRYLAIARRCLRADGLFLLHTIGGNSSRTSYSPWFDRNIFPNTHLPSARQLAAACEGQFVIEDWHNFGSDYDRTLMAWFENFDRAWPELRRAYRDPFYRVWKCFLLTSAGAFRARHFHTWQLVLSGSGLRGGYRAIR
jgi:cyclopropane-fatty-acyl-phospholipid synthase